MILFFLTTFRSSHYLSEFEHDYGDDGKPINPHYEFKKDVRYSHEGV